MDHDTSPHVEHPPSEAERPLLRVAHRLRLFLGLAVLVVALDQVTKTLVRANLSVGETWPEGWTLIRLAHVQNSGAAFGILQGAGTFLVIAPLIAIALITVYLLSLPAHSRLYPAALSLILGGAIGNLVDRIRLGVVTDFIDPWRYPAFNVADSCIVIGVTTIVLLAFLGRTPEDERAAAAVLDSEAHATPSTGPAYAERDR